MKLNHIDWNLDSWLLLLLFLSLERNRFVSVLCRPFRFLAYILIIILDITGSAHCLQSAWMPSMEYDSLPIRNVSTTIEMVKYKEKKKKKKSVCNCDAIRISTATKYCGYCALRTQNGHTSYSHLFGMRQEATNVSEMRQKWFFENILINWFFSIMIIMGISFSIWILCADQRSMNRRFFHF